MAGSIWYHIPLCGIWGMVMSPGGARPRWPSVIPELRLFAGILQWKPPHQLHVNLGRLRLYHFGCPALQTHDEFDLPTHHRSVFSLWLFSSPLLLWSYLLPCIKTPNSFMHAHNHMWGFWHVAALNRAPVTKTLPAVLGIHLLFHTRADLWAQQLQACNSLGCRGLRSRRQVGERRKW